VANTKITAANIDSTSTGITLADLTVNGDINLGDNDKAIFGAGSDASIFSDGSNGYMRGFLALQNNVGDQDFISFADGGATSLYYDNGAKLATTSTGIDVTGTTTTNNLTIDDGVIEFDKPSVYGFRFLHNDAGNDLSIQQGDANNANYVTRLNINSSGNLQLGTTSSSQTILQFLSATNGANTIHFGDGSSADAYRGYINYNHTGDRMEFATSGTERMRIDSSGAVGIGQVPETARFSGHDILQVGGRATLLGNDTVSATGQTVLLDNLYYDASGTFQHRGDSRGVAMQFVEGQVIFSNSNQTTGTPTVSERMRINSVGNLLVGTTDSTPYNNSSGSSADNGFAYQASTSILSVARYTTTTASSPFLVNRTGSDGVVAEFRKDGSTVGTIGAKDGDMALGTGDTGLRFIDGSDAITPHNTSTNAGRDNAIDLGSSGARFKDLYLSSKVNLGDTNRNLMYRSANNDLLLEAASGLFYRQDIGNTNHSWFTGNTERMRIQSNGRTALFQTTGGGALTIRGEGGTSFIAISFTHNSDNGVGYIQTASSSVTYSTSSDYRLKENVVPMENGLERIQKLKPVKFNWKLDGEESEGFLAHEVQEAGWNDGITGSKDDNLIEEGQQTYQGMDYGRITPLLVKAIQEQQTIIDDLKSRIEVLEG